MCSFAKALNFSPIPPIFPTAFSNGAKHWKAAPIILNTVEHAANAALTAPPMSVEELLERNLITVIQVVLISNRKA